MYGVPPSAYPHIAAEFATIRCAERAKLIAVLRIALEGVEALLDRPTDHDMNSTREKREIRAAYQAGNRALDALRTALAKGADAP